VAFGPTGGGWAFGPVHLKASDGLGVAFGTTGGGWAFGPVHPKASDGLGVQAKEGTAPTGGGLRADGRELGVRSTQRLPSDALSLLLSAPHGPAGRPNAQPFAAFLVAAFQRGGLAARRTSSDRPKSRRAYRGTQRRACGPGRACGCFRRWRVEERRALQAPNSDANGEAKSGSSQARTRTGTARARKFASGARNSGANGVRRTQEATLTRN
jgi:hypothetical protein